MKASRRLVTAGLAIVVMFVGSGCSRGSDPGATIAGTNSGTSRGADWELIDAAWTNDVARAEQLIADGADVNFQDDTRQSAYLIATSEGYLELLELTLDHGADVSSLDSFNGTGLIRAAERGHADVVARLLRTNIAVDHINNLGWTALHEAIILGDGSEPYVRTIDLLLAHGADPGLPTGRGQLPLALAEDRGQSAVAERLRAALAD